MTLNEYQEQALKTDYKPDGNYDVTSIKFMAHILGLVGEAGEFADKMKKIYRDKQGEMSPEEHELILKELGDVLWYVSTLAHYFGADLDSIADKNLQKLADRAKRDAITGKGDSR